MLSEQVSRYSHGDLKTALSRLKKSWLPCRLNDRAAEFHHDSTGDR